MKKIFKKAQVTTVLATTLLGFSTMALSPKVAAAPSFGGPFNCDANAVVWCGAKNVNTLQNDYNHGDGHNSAKSIQTIYNYFGISSSDIANLGNTAVAGSVTKGGDVYVGNKLVATNALTGGREYISGSSKVTRNGVTFYTRKPSVSFLNNSLTAYVVIQNGQFKFAFLSACGNPVKATPKAPNKGDLACTQLLTTPGTIESNGDQTVTFTAKATASNAKISKYVFSFGNGHGSQTVNTSAASVTSSKQTYAPGTYEVSVAVSGQVNNIYSVAPSTAFCARKLIISKPTPTCKAPNGQSYPAGSASCNTCQYNNELSANSSLCVPPTTPTPPSTPTAKVLPNTGPGNIIGLFLGVTFFGAIGYHISNKRRLARR